MSSKPSLARRALCEPLLHFVVLGGLLFALHGALASAPADEDSLRVGAQKRAELSVLFERRMQRKPSAREVDALVRSWAEEEVLFQEALRLDLVRQDPALRDQLIARMRALLQASIPLPTPDARALDAYYAQHRARYREPARLTFREYLVPSGSGAEDAARELLRRLRGGEPVAEQPVMHSERGEAELAALYGTQFTARLSALAPDAFQLLRSPRGLHVVNLASFTPSREPSRDELAARLRADLGAELSRQRFEQGLRELTARWQVLDEGAPP